MLIRLSRDRWVCPETGVMIDRTGDEPNTRLIWSRPFSLVGDAALTVLNAIEKATQATAWPEDRYTLPDPQDAEDAKECRW